MSIWTRRLWEAGPIEAGWAQEQGLEASTLVGGRDDQVYMYEDPLGAAGGWGGRSIYHPYQDPVGKRGCKLGLSGANWADYQPSKLATFQVAMWAVLGAESHLAPESREEQAAPGPGASENQARREAGLLAPGLEGSLCLWVGPRKQGCDLEGYDGKEPTK